MTMKFSSKTATLPFLKWAGGKRWFVSKHHDKFPRKFSTYIEPFLGSGAVYFFLRPDRAILSDTNSDLILTYRAIKKNWQRIQELLCWHQRKHCIGHYYKMRDKSYKDQYYRASRLIYLNRTCWNALYRVNALGSFNVPIGTKTQVILDTDRFSDTSEMLQNAQLAVCDFEETIDKATEGDFIFADPPYTASHKSNGFLKYNEEIFSWDDQIRLCSALSRAKERGARILVTNGDHHSIRDLYSSLGEIHSIERASIIAARSADRKVANEILVCA